MPLVTGGRTLLWFDTRTLAVALELELGVLIAGFGLVFAVLLPVQHRPQRIMRWIAG